MAADRQKVLKGMQSSVARLRAKNERPLVEILVIAALIGIIPANIAKNKGYDFVVWWIYGALLFIVALPHSLMLKDARTDQPKAGWYAHKDGGFRYWDGNNWSSETAQRCPHCAEYIKTQANVCRFCGRDVPVSVGSN
jgi:hypothetical protein